MDRRVASALGFLGSDRLRWPLSLLLGVLLWAASLPPYGIGILAVLAFVPLLYSLPGVPMAKVLSKGWLAGTLWEFSTLWWLIPTLVRYGNIAEPLALLLVLGMCGVLGLYMAGFLGTMAFLVKRRGDWAIVLAPFAWVLWEWLRGVLLSGFPWWGPGYALSLYPAFLQGTRLFGILGLSFLALLGSAAVTLYLRDRHSTVALVTVPVALVLLVGSYVAGAWWNAQPVEPRPAMPVGYLQPQIPQNRKWDPQFSGMILKRTLDLSMAFQHYGLKLLVWPESSTPFEWDADATYRRAVAKVAGAINSPILVGSVLSSSGGYQNGAVLVMPDGKEAGRYAKTHLVPFGEYVPLRQWLFFARPIVEEVGEFAPGHSLQPLSLPEGKVGVTICYEGIFPSLVRREVRNGAQLLVNMTNDAWYRGTPGPDQDFLMQRVRAVENDRYLIRSANGGVSGVITPRGQLQAATPKGQPASFWGLVEFRSQRTLWDRVGNAWLLLPLLVILFFARPSRANQPGARLSP